MVSLGKKMGRLFLLAGMTLCLMQAGAGAAAYVATEKPVYSPGEAIVVIFKDFPATQSGWITVVPSSANPEQYGQWWPLREQAGGTLIFDGLPAGEYEVRGFFDGKSNPQSIKTPLQVQVKASFSIVREAKPALPVVSVKETENLSAQEAHLARLINQYRRDNGLGAIPVSRTLTRVARLHVRDLDQYQPQNATDSRGLPGNLHSWSDKGNWTSVIYTADHQYAAAMWNKPREISNQIYLGNGFEIAFGTQGHQATPESALAAWLDSPGHKAVIMESGDWQDKHWPAMGVAVYGGYAVVWFGDTEDPVGYYSL
ncbi:CAP domain-containing protein [Acetonema longum]|uniref:Allergen V5/Tpx-1 family protein n=1 Tax=Acetonema longum DSM 6540 TaxID=1009370 RepID=F7NG84_9FIRM|nr:CAP domain-containing protein [Acetonema longum]EGO65002.1 Allergen V5/Tpx-1 family protein [Acetonema longum DSM 6540]